MTGELVLLVSDDASILHAGTEALSLHGYTVESVADGNAAVSRLEESWAQRAGFELLVVDLNLPDGDGLAVLRRGCELDPLLSTIVITDHGTFEKAIAALNSGASKVLLKPVAKVHLLLAAKEALAERVGPREQHRLEIQSLVLRTSQVLTTSSTIESLVGELLRVVVRQMGADWAIILLRDEAKRDWHVAGTLGEGATSDGEPRAWRRLLERKDLSGDVLLSSRDAAVALHTAGKTLGLLGLGRSRSRFAPSEQDFLTILAAQAAIILENLQLRQAVAQAEREWTETSDAIADGILIHDTEFRILRVNRTLTDWLGVASEDLVGHTCYSIIHDGQEKGKPLTFCDVIETIAWDRPNTVEIEEPSLGRTLSISTYPMVNGQGHVTGAVHVMQDITERKRAEQYLNQSEKLAVLGRLAAHLAHEINNPLQALRSGLGLLLKDRHDQQKQHQYLEVANREVERLITLTDGILDFYRPSPYRRELVDLNDGLDEVLTLTSKKMQHARVTLSCDLDRRIPAVEVVVDQLRQVFLNIVLNALEAMPDGGHLTISSGYDANIREVWVSFTDTGEGIPAETISRIFTPLYSSKPQGTGLGLTISYGIIERHRGRIEVQSEVGRGSTFTVFLPIEVIDTG